MRMMQANLCLPCLRARKPSSCGWNQLSSTDRTRRTSRGHTRERLWNGILLIDVRDFLGVSSHARLEGADSRGSQGEQT